MNGNTWTRPAEIMLEKLWREGKFASEIAREMQAAGYKVTRCSAIGKANRMQLPARGSPIVRSYPVRPAPKANLKVIKTMSEPQTGITLLELTPQSCRWPQGDPKREGFTFCGKQREGRSYCGDHEKIAFSKSHR